MLFKFVGTEFFPDSDESQFSLSVKLPVGTRIEETEKYITKVEDVIRQNVPEAKAIISDIGIPKPKERQPFRPEPGNLCWQTFRSSLLNPHRETDLKLKL